MLQWLALGKDPQAWADRVKERRDLQPEEVQKWIRGPTSVDRLTEALAASYTAQIARKAKRGGGLSSEASSSEKPKARKDQKKRKRSSSSPPAKAPAKKKKKSESSESDSSAKKKRKSKKEDKKKDKKEPSKKKKESSTASSSTASAKSTKKEKKRKSEKPRTVKVYPITGATADGKMVVKKTNVHHKVEIDEAMTVSDIQLKLLTALGYEADFANWSCRLLEEDGKISTVAPEFPAKDLVGGLVLVKKGG